jgi:fatty acid desaturase
LDRKAQKPILRKAGFIVAIAALFVLLLFVFFLVVALFCFVVIYLLVKTESCYVAQAGLDS